MAEESLKLFEEWLERNRGTPQAAYVEQLLALQEESDPFSDRGIKPTSSQARRGWGFPAAEQ